MRWRRVLLTVECSTYNQRCRVAKGCLRPYKPPSHRVGGLSPRGKLVLWIKYEDEGAYSKLSKVFTCAEPFKKPPPTQVAPMVKTPTPKPMSRPASITWNRPSDSAEYWHQPALCPSPCVSFSSLPKDQPGLEMSLKALLESNDKTFNNEHNC